MLPNKDKISRPAKGRFFPITVPEIIKTLSEHGFQHSEYKTRVDIFFQNPSSHYEYGADISAIYPCKTIVVCSLSEEFSPLHGKMIVNSALQQLSEIDKKYVPHWNSNKITSFRVYLGSLNKLIITERTRTLKLSKYRGTAKFSYAFNPKSVSTKESILFEFEKALS